MKDYTSQKVDWDVYIERKQPIYLFASISRGYVKLLKQVTGFGFDNQLCWVKEGSGIFYNSITEMESADKYYLQLIQDGDERLEQWRDAGVEWNQKADDLIKRFTGEVSLDVIKSEFDELQDQTEQVIVFSTLIPYRMLSAVNYAIDHLGATEADYKNVLELFEPLRADTRYPQLVDTVYRSMWKAAAQQFPQYNEDIFSLTVADELREILVEGKVSILNDIKKRDVGCAFWLDEDSFVFNYDDDFLDNVGIKHDEIADVTDIKGSTANGGKVKGMVRIINDSNDIGEFNEGDIVVSINTSPSLMPVLKKCGGIVTDEGGIMCHAAIVSRELNKPCVIGTKIATKVLKDGDEVEVDADQGLVKIISQL